MRIVRDLSQVSSSFDSCQREALTAFGRNEVFLEGKLVNLCLYRTFIDHAHTFFATTSQNFGKIQSI